MWTAVKGLPWRLLLLVCMQLDLQTLFVENTTAGLVIQCIRLYWYTRLRRSITVTAIASVTAACYCTATALLPCYCTTVAVTAIHTNAKVVCDVTACCDVTAYSTNNHLLMIISIIFKNRRYHMYFGFDSFVLSNCTPNL